jgi:hypothetical protein
MSTWPSSNCSVPHICPSSLENRHWLADGLIATDPATKVESILQTPYLRQLSFYNNNQQFVHVTFDAKPPPAGRGKIFIIYIKPYLGLICCPIFFFSIGEWGESVRWERDESGVRVQWEWGDSEVRVSNRTSLADEGRRRNFAGSVWSLCGHCVVIVWSLCGHFFFRERGAVAHSHLTLTSLLIHSYLTLILLSSHTLTSLSNRNSRITIEPRSTLCPRTNRAKKLGVFFWFAIDPPKA